MEFNFLAVQHLTSPSALIVCYSCPGEFCFCVQRNKKSLVVFASSKIQYFFCMQEMV